MPLRAHPFLMFEGRAEEAMNHYVATVPGCRIASISRFGPSGPGPDGSVMRAVFEVGGIEVMCTDSFVRHAFTFTPSVSLFLSVASEAEVDTIATALGQGGTFLMPAGNYGFSKRFAWLNDRFGVSWQINCD